MVNLRAKLQKHLPHTQFTEAAAFYWSPKTNTIYLNSSALDTPEGMWALLHEAGHAIKAHQSYKTDAGLLMLEVEAWEIAKTLGEKWNVFINEDHIQDCLDTYRNWLYARSTCPSCMLNSLQVDETTYMCLNCSTRWSVSASRFCRPYRMQNKHKKTPPEQAQTVFM